MLKQHWGWSCNSSKWASAELNEEQSSAIAMGSIGSQSMDRESKKIGQRIVIEVCIHCENWMKWIDAVLHFPGTRQPSTSKLARERDNEINEMKQCFKWLQERRYREHMQNRSVEPNWEHWILWRIQWWGAVSSWSCKMLKCRESQAVCSHVLIRCPNKYFFYNSSFLLYFAQLNFIFPKSSTVATLVSEAHNKHADRIAPSTTVWVLSSFNSLCMRVMSTGAQLPLVQPTKSKEKASIRVEIWKHICCNGTNQDAGMVQVSMSLAALVTLISRINTIELPSSLAHA